MGGFGKTALDTGIGAAAGYGVNKAGQAIFGGGAQNAAQPVNAATGGPGSANMHPAVQLLMGLQQQMQQEEQQRQQSMQQLLMSQSRGLNG